MNLEGKMRMEYPFTIVVVLFSVCILAGSSYARIAPETIVGIWLFDEEDADVAEDLSENGFDGEFVGEIEWVEGKFGLALEFGKGGGDMVKIPHNEKLTLSTYSLVAWIKVAEVTGVWQDIIAKNGPPRNYGMWTFNNSGLIHHSFFDVANNNYVSNSTSQVTDDQWRHIAATYDKEFSKVYVDGILEGRNAFSDEPAPNNFAVTIGGGPENSPATHQLTGVIDEAAIFNVGLTEEDIKKIMNSGLSRALGITAVSSACRLTTTWGSIRGRY
jgi:hypothetical protein